MSTGSKRLFTTTTETVLPITNTTSFVSYFWETMNLCQCILKIFIRNIYIHVLSYIYLILHTMKTTFTKTTEAVVPVSQL